MNFDPFFHFIKGLEFFNSCLSFIPPGNFIKQGVGGGGGGYGDNSSGDEEYEEVWPETPDDALPSAAAACTTNDVPAVAEVLRGCLQQVEAACGSSQP